MSDKVDEILIKVTGNKVFRQHIVDKVYAMLMEDDDIFDFVECQNRGNGYTFTSSLEPSDEVR